MCKIQSVGERIGSVGLRVQVLSYQIAAFRKFYAANVLAQDTGPAFEGEKPGTTMQEACSTLASFHPAAFREKEDSADFDQAR
jgi:hypothetical protein